MKSDQPKGPMTVDLVSPANPPRGMNSACPPPYLSAGEAESLTNLRIVRGYVARNGIATIELTGLPTGELCGSDYVSLDGDDMIVLAMRVGAETLVFTAPIEGGAVSEITTEDGAFGSTRFDAEGWVTFAIAQDRGRKDIDPTDCLVIQNGADSPRVYAKDTEAAFGGGYVMSVSADPDSPTDDKTLTLFQSFRSGFYLSTPSTATTPYGRTYSSSGSNMALSDGADGIQLIADDGTADGDSATVVFDQSLDLSESPQLMVVYREPNLSAALLASVKIEIGDGADWTEVLGQGRLYTDGSVVPLSDIGLSTNKEAPYWLVGLDVPEDGDADLTAIDRVRFTYVSDSPLSIASYLERDALGDGGDTMPDNELLRPGYDWETNMWKGYYVRIIDDSSVPAAVGQVRRITGNTNSRLYIAPNWTANPSGNAVFQIIDGLPTLEIHAMNSSGTEPGNHAFAVAFASSQARSEGAATVCTRRTIQWDGSGGAFQSDVTPAPLSDPRFFYDYRLVWTESSMMAQGVDMARVYLNDKGVQDDYLYVATVPMFAYAAGSWSATGYGGHGAGTDQYWFSFGGEDQDVINMLPDGTLGTPIGLSMATANERLFVAPESRVYYSRYQRPFAFSKFQSPGDELSSSSFVVDGEKVKALVAIGQVTTGAEALGSAQVGSASLFFLTDRTLSLISGWDATSLNKRVPLTPYGTQNPRSVAITRSGIVYLSGNQVVRWDGRLSALSRWRVDDRLSGLTGASGAFVKDKYWLTASGGVLVYDDLLDAWLMDTAAEAGYASLMAHPDGRLLAFDGLGAMYEHDKESEDGDEGSGAVEVGITFREIPAPGEESLLAKRVRVECDPVEGGELTVTRAGRDRYSVDSAVGAVGLDSDGSRVRKVDSSDGGGIPGAIAGAVSVTIAGAVAKGWRLMSASLEVETVGGFGPDVD